MTSRCLALALAVGLLLVPGRAGATRTENGPLVNGKYLNGKYLNGKYLNGKYLNGKYLNSTYLNGSMIVAVDQDGVERIDLIGAELEASANDAQGNPTTLSLRIDDIVAGDQPDITLYRVTYRTYEWIQLYDEEYGIYYWNLAESWQPICDGDGLAVPVEGEWDIRVGRRGAGGKIGNSTGITLACTSGAIGKCVSRMHYKPWTGEFTSHYGNGAHWGWQWYGWGYSESGGYEEWARDGDLAHRACVRMVRADYCADGHDHTMEGTEIDVGDNFSPSINQLGARPWQLEAYWGPDGALCVNEPRWATLVHAGACVCDYSGGTSCIRGDQIGLPGVDYVPFTEGCEPIAGTIFNRSSTLPADSDWVPW